MVGKSEIQIIKEMQEKHMHDHHKMVFEEIAD